MLTLLYFVWVSPTESPKKAPRLKDPFGFGIVNLQEA